MAERDDAAEKGRKPSEEDESEGFARRIYEKLERDDRLNYERIKIQDEIRQTVLSWGVAALAAIGAFLSGAAYLSYDRIIVSIAESIEESLDEKVQAALDSKLAEANRRMENVFQRAEDSLNRELDEVREDRKQVAATVIEARSTIASLEAQTDFVRASAVKASDAAVEATRSAEASVGRVAEIDGEVRKIREGLEKRAGEFEEALARADEIQVSIRDAIKKLNEERAALSAEIARFERRLAVVEARIDGLDGAVDGEAVAAIRAEEAQLAAVQKLKIVFYVSRWNSGADIQRVLKLHDALVARGVPNAPFATEDNSGYAAVAAEIDDDFTGVRRHLAGGSFQLFAAPSRRSQALSLIEMLKEIEPGIDIAPVFEEFVVTDDKFRQLARDRLAPAEDVVLITKMPPRDF